MKTLLITHTDLDGISPIILMNLTKIKFEYKSIEISEIPNTFEELFQNGFKGYDKVYVTDLSLTEEIYERLINNKINVEVFDHHVTHDFANKYPFVTVKVNENGVMTCGTELFYNHLKTLYPELDTPLIKDYVKQVRELDTYNFTSDLPKGIDSIKDLLGRNEFIKSITKRLKGKKTSFELTSFEKRYIRLKSLEIERYIQKKELKMKTYTIKEHKCGIVFAETNKSELGNYLSSKHPELDLIAVIDASSRISYRTVRDDVHVELFAAMYGGGGHQKASGSFFSDEMREQIVKQIFDDVKRLENENL